MQSKVNYIYLFLSIFLNAFLFIPFVITWLAVFLLVFLGISGLLSGLFLIFSYLSSFQINLVPVALYENPLLLWSYATFFVGVGGFVLTLMAVFFPRFLSFHITYYRWTQRLIGGNHDETI